MFLKTFDFDEKFKVFLNIIHDFSNKSCQIKVKTYPPEKHSCPWITEGLVNCNNEKHRLHRTSVQNPVLRNDYIT